MSPPANAFSWSHARHETFQACLKRYYFAYYAAWGGWEESAPPRTRDLFVLKRLSTRQQWAGHHAHQAIAFLIQQARRDPDGSTAAAAESRQIERMRREFRDSRAGAYRQNPLQIPGLFEHEYRLEVPDAEWKATVDRVALAIRNFLASDLWAALRKLPDDAILSVERRAHFHLDGLKVHAVPDLVTREDGQIRIYEWKTGRDDPAGHRTQAGIYGLLAADRWTADPAEIQAVVFNPVLGQRQTFEFDPDGLETLREFIRDSADEMLFPLADPQTNDPGEGSAFDCTDDADTCKSCPFLRACPRWNS